MIPSINVITKIKMIVIEDIKYYSVLFQRIQRSVRYNKE